MTTTSPDRSASRLLAQLVGRFDRWLLAPAPPERLAALRVLIGGFVLVYLVVTIGEFSRVTRLPASQFEPVGIFAAQDGPLSDAAVWALFALLMVSGIAFVAGAGFRISGPAFALGTLAWASYHSSWGQMLHYEHLFTLHLMIVGAAPAADAWSVRATARRRDADPSLRYGWPVRLAALVTASTYLIAGLTKLRISGAEWVDSESLRNHIAYSATRQELLGAPEPPLASLVVGAPAAITPLAVAALAVELAAPVALLGGRPRRWWVVAALGFHAGTAATMMVWFAYQGTGFALLPLYRAERVIAGGRSLGRRARDALTR